MLVWGRKVGGRWEAFHTLSYLPSKQMYYFGKHGQTLRWAHLEFLEAAEKVGEVDNPLSWVATESQPKPRLSKAQHRWEPWPQREPYRVQCNRLDRAQPFFSSCQHLQPNQAQRSILLPMGGRKEVSPAPFFKNMLVKEKGTEDFSHTLSGMTVSKYFVVLLYTMFKRAIMSPKSHQIF